MLSNVKIENLTMELYQNEMILSTSFSEDDKIIINEIWKIRLRLAGVDYKLRNTIDLNQTRMLLKLSYELNKKRIEFCDKVYLKNSAA